MGSLFESQVFTGYDWALPEAVKSVAGDEHCWKWGCENLCVLAVGTLTERPLEQMTHPQTQPPPPQCTNAHFGCFPFHTHFVSKKYFNIPVIFFFCTFPHCVCPPCLCNFCWVGFLVVFPSQTSKPLGWAGSFVLFSCSRGGEMSSEKKLWRWQQGVGTRV